jgi:hypothetical protein
MILQEKIFGVDTEAAFHETALGVFRYQFTHNPFYRRFCEALGAVPERVTGISRIPFLPIGFFRQEEIVTGTWEPERIFQSSGTTGMERSLHRVRDLSLYRQSLMSSFTRFYGSPEKYHILALTPRPDENPASSLIYMVDELMSRCVEPKDGWYLDRKENLKRRLLTLRDEGRKTILIGLTWALLDFAESFSLEFPELIVVETGGMKGRRRELLREELHQVLKAGFGVERVHSEYSMTELLSQAWSDGEGIFRCPPWMRIVTRDPNDPLTPARPGETGGICIIDLANLHSCSFIATQDLGIVYEDNSFEVLGRFDNSDLRGCSLMVV